MKAKSSTLPLTGKPTPLGEHLSTPFRGPGWREGSPTVRKGRHAADVAVPVFVEESLSRLWLPCLGTRVFGVGNGQARLKKRAIEFDGQAESRPVPVDHPSGDQLLQGGVKPHRTEPLHPLLERALLTATVGLSEEGEDDAPLVWCRAIPEPRQGPVRLSPGEGRVSRTPRGNGGLERARRP